MASISRRNFIKTAASGAIITLASGSKGFAGSALEPAIGVENPLKHYPSRDWEKVYRDIYKPDSSYIFMCTPNCTHNCYLRAYVKNGVVVRVGPSQNYHKATDVYGTKASQRWDPRHCNKGIALVRRFYGDRRVKSPMVRKGFLEWVEKGFPRDAKGMAPQEMFRRGEDQYVAVPWEKAYEIAAKTFIEISKTYSGETGAKYLKEQDYDEAMIKRLNGAGTRAMKFRGGMPALGSIKLFGQYRFANSMALLDKYLRNVSENDAVGGVGLDNYTWHTDLPPGHPMVCGQQTIDFDLATTEYCNILVCWGMNWISTKMPDGHWLTEARLKGKKIVVITTEYNSTCSKADEIVIIRPGTDPALALGIAHVLFKEKLYDVNFVKTHTDLPMLVRMDTGMVCKANEVFGKGYKPKEIKLKKVVAEAKDLPKPAQVNVGMPGITQQMRDEWNDFVMYDSKTKKFVAVSSDDVGEHFHKLGIDPVLEGEFEANIDGKTVKLRPIFEVIKQHLYETWTPENTSKVTWAPQSAIYSLARQFAKNPEHVLFAVGMGPNQMFNADQKDRGILLVAALTRNIGFFGGNVGSYAGNYRAAYFNGMPQYMAENPFDITLDPTKPAKIKPTYAMQSAHFYSHGDQPLKVHNVYFNGKTHMPFPTKSIWFTGSNSLLGNAKGHFELVMNLLRHPGYRAKGMHHRMIEAVFVNEWWWSPSCEYADIVFAADSWAEYNVHDFTQSCTNPFMQVMPLTEIKRIHNTKSNTEIYQGVSHALAKITGDKRFVDYWAFIDAPYKAKPYMQRVLNCSNMFKGYDVEDLLVKSKDGIPVMMMGKTYPKFIGYEQSNESKPWFTKSGRLEFYRDEKEFQDYGECIPLHREPIDSTWYEPNAIVASPHPLIRPKKPEDYGWPSSDQTRETRQARNVVYTVDQLLKTEHPLIKDGYNFIWLTPKYRHSVHTMFADLDYLSVWWGPFGDIYRKDKRKPWVGEGYMDIHPQDAKAYGIEDGDYIWVDADPEDQPFKGWQERPNEYKVSRCMLRARYYPGTARGVVRTWFNMYMASFGSVKGHLTRKDGLAKSPDTGYQSMYRFGGHQSGTRSWLRPTLLTDTLVRKELMGQATGQGFCPDVHCANGAPRESFVKFSKAEDGGESGTGKWRPVTLGGRPTHESENFKKYLSGQYIS